MKQFLQNSTLVEGWETLQYLGFELVFQYSYMYLHQSWTMFRKLFVLFVSVLT